MTAPMVAPEPAPPAPVPPDDDESWDWAGMEEELGAEFADPGDDYLPREEPEGMTLRELLNEGPEAGTPLHAHYLYRAGLACLHAHDGIMECSYRGLPLPERWTAHRMEVLR